MEFKKFEVKDIEKVNKYLLSAEELSCENTFANLFIWQKIYGNRYLEKDNTLFIKSGWGEDELYNIPFTDDMPWAMEEIKRFCKGRMPHLWTQEGERLKCFKEAFGDYYNFFEQPENFDYIYLREDLATLSGGKYHSKRNHISAFSKKYDWRYEAITKENLDLVKDCERQWYTENKERFDESMRCEKEGLEFILDNMDSFSALGGCIIVEDKVVAFTLGTAVNKEIFDVHFEKSLMDYATAYSVINQQFAENALKDFKYINREDDLGIEGLRRAKLSYKPVRILKKYLCIPKDMSALAECRKIYKDAFGESKEFDDILFCDFFKYCHYLKIDNQVVSMLFAFPVNFKNGYEEGQGFYIYGVATDKDKRGKGYMARLINSLEGDFFVLKPVNESVVKFYEKTGFKCVNTNLKNNEKLLELGEEFYVLTALCEQEKENFTLMYKSKEDISFDDVSFLDTMH